MENKEIIKESEKKERNKGMEYINKRRNREEGKCKRSNT